MSKPTVTAVIPARYASTRFPGKPLVKICGKPMIQWTYEKASAAQKVNSVVVATDDQRIFDCVVEFGGNVVMTAEDHPSGTDRIAEAIGMWEGDLIINVQGDEPAISSSVIDKLVERMLETGAEMGTAGVPISRDSEAFTNPNVVKLVKGLDDYALYFSRASIPFLREGGEETTPLKHWGLYAYTREFVGKFLAWPEGALEKCEKLEQLRAMENGARILVITATEDSIGVDTPEDIAKVEAILSQS